MSPILSDYLEVCLQFRKEGLSKPERKKRHSLMTEWANKPYGEGVPKISELCEFWDKYGEFCYNKIFIIKTVVAPVALDLENGGIGGLRFLFRCFREHDSYIYSDSPLAIFCEASGHKFEPFQLANILLSKDPENKDALKYKYYRLKYNLEFSLHELPFGILNGMNGANISDIPNMLCLVDKFHYLSNRLMINNDNSLINDCRRFYPAYKDYLQHQNEYADFKDYLKKNNIPHHLYCSTYYYDS